MKQYKPSQMIRNYKTEAVFLIAVAFAVLLIDKYVD
jgi:hypothetical protein